METKRPRGLATRFNILTIAIILVSSLVITAYHVAEEIRNSDRELVNDGRAIAAMMAESSEYGIYAEDRVTLRKILDGIDAGSDIVYARFLDAGGNVLADRSRKSSIKVPDGLHRGKAGPPGTIVHEDFVDPGDGVRYLDILAPVTSVAASEFSGIFLTADGAPKVIGYVRLGMTTESRNAHVRRFLASAAAFTTVLILVGVMLTLLVSRRIASPIRRLVAFTQSVSEERLDERIAVGGSAEIAELANSFNGMLERLKASRDQVAERTEALASANRRMELEIAERRRAEASLQDSEEQLRQSQKMEAIGKLAGGIAHDFNNLLTAINGYGEILHARLPEGDPMRLEVEEIRKAGERAAALTSQLLAFSRKQMMQPRVLNLNAVIADMDRMLRRLIGENIEFETSPAENLWLVRVDPGQIEQVILNLVVNARDAVRGGGRIVIGTGNVAVAGRSTDLDMEVEAGDYVRIAVADTGCGMDPGTRARIFEPFFTTKEQGKGTGLGLSTVYGIVRQSRGHIRVDSAPGKGSRFEVYLPRTEEVEAEAPSAERQASARWTGSETLLLVEDEDLVRDLVRTILRERGYTIVEARDGTEALEVGRKHPGPIHLLLSDVVMPRMGGRELAARFARVRPGCKVLFMSGYTEDAIVHQGVLESGATFIQKPFKAETLARKVRETLDT